MVRGTLACGALVALFAGTASADLITNGGFETGDFTGWSAVDPNGDHSVSVQPIGGDDDLGVVSHSGTFFAWLGSYNGQHGSISQTLSASAGQTVHLSFWLENASIGNGYTPNDFLAQLDGQSVLSMTNNTTPGYIHWTFDVTLNNNNPLLMFTFNQEPGTWALDDVSADVVTAVPLPPAAYAGLSTLAGVCGLGTIRRRRRARA